MGWTKTKDREEAYRSAINMWIKAKPLFGEVPNMVMCKAIIEQNKRRRAEMMDSYGSSRNHPDDLRIGLSLPPGLYYTLKKLEEFHGNVFLETKEDMWWFARKFPQFTICERI